MKIAFPITRLILPIIYIIIGYIVYKIISNFIKNRLKITHREITQKQQKRIDTIKLLLINIIKYFILILVILLILVSFNIDIKSILAGLGITTAILGLALQDFVKDLIAGITIITEAQYEVGDIIEIDNFKGTVTSIGLKTTKIKDYKGRVKIISNRYMDNIINYSMNNSLAIIDLEISKEENIDNIENILNIEFKKLKEKINYIKTDITILGIESITPSSNILRITTETEIDKQYQVERLLKKEIIKLFRKENIKIPYNKIEVKNGK